MSLFGTGRVMSQTTTHAVFFPFASSASGFVPMGFASAASSAAAGSGSGVGRADRQRRGDQPVVREGDVEAGLAVVEGDLHCGVSGQGQVRVDSRQARVALPCDREAYSITTSGGRRRCRRSALTTDH